MQLVATKSFSFADQVINMNGKQIYSMNGIEIENVIVKLILSIFMNS